MSNSIPLIESAGDQSSLFGNKTLVDEVNKFLVYLTDTQHVQLSTVKAYKNVLSQAISFLNPTDTISFTEFTDENNVNFESLISYFSTKPNGKPYAASTIAHKRYVLRAFFKYLKQHHAITNNPMETLPAVKVGRSLPKVLKVSEVQSLVDNCSQAQPFVNLRDRTMIQLSYASGLRVGELVSLSLTSIDLEERVGRVIGKGNKEREFVFDDSTKQALTTYLKERYQLDTEDDALFVNNRMARISTRQVERVVKGAAKKAGIKGKVTPHTLRHTFATNYLKGGGNIREVQQALGHASITTTQIYTHVDSSQLLESYDRAFTSLNLQPTFTVVDSETA